MNCDYKFVLIIILIICFALALHGISNERPTVDESAEFFAEPFAEDSISNEAIQNVASIYASGNTSMTKLNITDELTANKVSATDIGGGSLSMSNVTGNNLAANSNIQFKGKNIVTNTNRDNALIPTSIPSTWTTYPRPHSNQTYSDGKRVCPAGQYVAGMERTRTVDKYGTKYDTIQLICRPLFA